MKNFHVASIVVTFLEFSRKWRALDRTSFSIRSNLRTAWSASLMLQVRVPRRCCLRRVLSSDFLIEASEKNRCDWVSGKKSTFENDGNAG